MTHILMKEGRPTHQLQDYVLSFRLRKEDLRIMVRTNHIADALGGLSITLEAVLIRV